MELFEKTLSSQVLYEGRIVSVFTDQILLPDGREAKRELVRHPGGVCVLALDPDDNLLMVRQFRYPFGETLLELPAGKLEPEEDPATCGQRELREETGYTAAQFNYFGVFFPSPGYLSERIHIYTAADLSFVGQDLDPGEFLKVERIPFTQALDMVLSGAIPDGKTQVAILKYALLKH